VFSVLFKNVSPHTDTDTVHSHIIVNAVSFETGKKFHMNIGEYRNSKDLADVIGAELGFTPMDWKTKTAEKLDRIFADDEITPDKKYLTHAEIQIAKRDESGGASWKEALRQAIDEAKAVCTTRAEFQQFLQSDFGVTMPRNTGKTVSFVHPAVGETYAIRGNKLGSDYTADSIDQALKQNAERSSINAGLFITEEQQHTAASAAASATVTANPVSNIPIIGSQSAVQTGNRERIAPGSLSEVSAELRSLDNAVSRVAKGVHADDDNADDGASASDETVGGNSIPQLERIDGNGGEVQPIPQRHDRQIQRNSPQPDRTAQPKSPEPVVEVREHERIVQPKPKKRSNYITAPKATIWQWIIYSKWTAGGR